MSTHITQLLLKRIKTPIIFIALSLLSAYPIYTNFYYANGLKTYERHRAIIERRSEFYNPWQYRILTPYIIEGILWLYNSSVDKLIPISKSDTVKISDTSGLTNETKEFVTLMNNPSAKKYMIVFILFRFIENATILVLCYVLWKHFIKSKWLLFFGINFLTLAMGNAVTVADLSFNTYLDIILYLIAAIAILNKWNPYWFIFLSILGALNRETSILIPALLLFSNVNYVTEKSNRNRLFELPQSKVIIAFIISIAAFLIIFILLRLHYGYRPQQMWKVPAGLQMLKLNLLSSVGIKGYFELLGTFGLIPFAILLKFNTFPTILKKWFLIITPVWFSIHFILVVSYQTRLFIVPFVVCIMPMFLILVERSLNSKQSINGGSSK